MLYGCSPRPMSCNRPRLTDPAPPSGSARTWRGPLRLPPSRSGTLCVWYCFLWEHGVIYSLRQNLLVQRASRYRLRPVHVRVLLSLLHILPGIMKPEPESQATPAGICRKHIPQFRLWYRQYMGSRRYCQRGSARVYMISLDNSCPILYTCSRDQRVVVGCRFSRSAGRC